MPAPSRSLLIALAIALGLTAWMLSGALAPERKSHAPGEEDGGPIGGRVSVQVREQTAEAVTRYLINQGQTEADRLITVKAETSGTVAEVGAEKGTRVAQGDLLVRLAMGDRQARLEEARARVAQAESELEAARRLEASGFQARLRVDEARAALASARARLAAIREDIGHTRVGAPFAGYLEERPVEIGTFLDVGSPVAVIADLDPLVVSVRVAQQRVGEVAAGTRARIVLADGREASGRVRYLARTADEDTRTYRVEIAVPNPEGAMRAGLSAEVRIPVGEARAHFVSPALLTLDDQGVLGVKTVGPEQRVAFHPVELVRATAEGVWVSGLPERARLITVGQGFARIGERVRAVPAPASAVPGPGSETGPVLPQPPSEPIR